MLAALFAGLVIVLSASVTFGTTVASAYAAKEKVLVVATHENATTGLDTAAVLRSLGFKVTLTLAPSTPSAGNGAAETVWRLPNLKAYSSVWSMTGSRVYDEEELAQVEQYVSAGGRLYLGGVPVSSESGSNLDEEIAHAVLVNSQVRVLAGHSAETSNFSEAALDGITQQPNDLLGTEIHQSAAGAITGIGLRNALTRFSRVFSSAAFDEADMRSGEGRLVIYPDEWPNSNLAPGLRNAFVENVQDFLEGTPMRVARTSAQYVGLGDSFASGVGSFEYQPETTGPKGCYRAVNGYVERIASDDELSLAFDACSGSTIGNLLERKATREPQLNDVGPDTKAITLSVGWDDLGLTNVVRKCVSSSTQPGLEHECRVTQNAAVEAAAAWLDNGREPGAYVLPAKKKSSNLQYLPSLAQLYETILYQAPGAELVIVGYPQLFESGRDTRYPPCQVGTSATSKPLYVTADDARWIDEQAIALDKQIERAIGEAQANTGRSIRYADANGAFIGHGLCDVETSWINPRLLEGTKPKIESFEPTVTGQEALRELVEETAEGF
jgi:hypothetical protein